MARAHQDLNLGGFIQTSLVLSQRVGLRSRCRRQRCGFRAIPRSGGHLRAHRGCVASLPTIRAANFSGQEFTESKRAAAWARSYEGGTAGSAHRYRNHVHCHRDEQQSWINRCRRSVPHRRHHPASQISEFGRRTGSVNDAESVTVGLRHTRSTRSTRSFSTMLQKSKDSPGCPGELGLQLGWAGAIWIRSGGWHTCPSPSRWLFMREPVQFAWLTSLA